MSINSKKKGNAGEREFANLLKEHGFSKARRGQQYAGINNDADVVGLPGFHIEVKRVEKLNLSKAMGQAVRDARQEEIPIVAHRKNREKWKITLLAEDFIDIIKGIKR